MNLPLSLERHVNRILPAWLVLLGVGLAFYSAVCPWSQDEALYMLAGDLFSKGRFPYLDFLFPQMPLSAIVFAAWKGLVGGSLVAHRALSIICLILTTAMMVRFLDEGKWAALLFLSNPMIWSYFVLVKPYALTTVLIFAALLALQKKKYLLTGLCVGCATDIRLFFVVQLVPCITWMWLNEKNRQRAVGAFFIGLTIGLLPALGFLIADPTLFGFNVFGYHRIRGSTPMSDLGPILWALKETLKEPSNFLLALVFLMGIYRLRREFRHHWLWVAATLLALLPALPLRPFFDEYLIAMIPFSVPIVSLALSPAGSKGRAYFYSIIILAAFLGTIDSFQKLKLDWQANASPSRPSNSIYSVANVAKTIKQFPTGKVMSFWPGYALVAERDSFPGMEHGLGVSTLAGKLSEADAQMFHVVTPTSIQKALAAHLPELIVVGLASPKGFEEMVQKNYRIAWQGSGAKIYLPQPVGRRSQ